MEDMNISENDLNFFDIELEEGAAYEIFLSGGKTSETDDLVWKDILREGEWAYRPGAGGKPVPVPLRVVAGKATSDKEIGMADLIASFDEQALDHVTVPTTHADKPEENTGFVKKLKIEDRNGKKSLQAGIEFTEPDIKGKALRGSIANTSAGVVFNYVKKDTGKTYDQVLGHVALTNKPWINGMKPFGMSEEFTFSEDEIIPLFLQDVVWDRSKALSSVRDKVSQAMRGLEGDPFVIDVTPSKALVAKFTDGKEQSYVVPFQITDNEVEISSQDNWISASQEWVETSLSDETSNIDRFKKLPPESQKELGVDKLFAQDLSEEGTPTQGAIKSDPEDIGGIKLGDTQKETPAPGAPSDPAPEVVGLSEDKVRELIEAETKEAKEEAVALSESNEVLRKQLHEMKVEKRITELSDSGFKHVPGLLAEIRNLYLADSGKDILTLSEDTDGKTSEVSLSVSKVIDRIVNAMPKTDDNKIDFSEMALVTDDTNRPDPTPDVEDVEVKAAELAEDLGIEYPKPAKEDK